MCSLERKWKRLQCTKWYNLFWCNIVNLAENITMTSDYQTIYDYLVPPIVSDYHFSVSLSLSMHWRCRNPIPFCLGFSYQGSKCWNTAAIAFLGMFFFLLLLLIFSHKTNCAAKTIMHAGMWLLVGTIYQKLLKWINEFFPLGGTIVQAFFGTFLKVYIINSSSYSLASAKFMPINFCDGFFANFY